MQQRDLRLALVVGLLGLSACGSEPNLMSPDGRPPVVVLHWFHPVSVYETAFDPTVDSMQAAPFVASINLRAALGQRLNQLAGVESRVLEWPGMGEPLSFTPEAGALLGRAMLTSPGAKAMPEATTRFLDSSDDGRRITSVTGSPVISNGRLLIRLRVVDAGGGVREDIYARWPAESGDLTLPEAIDRVVRAVEAGTGASSVGGAPPRFPMVFEESGKEVPFLYARSLGALFEGARFEGWGDDYAEPLLPVLRRHAFSREGLQSDSDIDRLMRLYLTVEVMADMNGAEVSDDPEWFEEISKRLLPEDPDDMVGELSATFASGWEQEDGTLEPFLWNAARRRFGELTGDLQILFSGYLGSLGGGRTTPHLIALRESLRDRGCFGGAAFLFDAGAIRTGGSPDSEWWRMAQLGYVEHLDTLGDGVMRGLLMPRRFAAELPAARRALLRDEWPGFDYDHGRRADVATLPAVNRHIAGPQAFRYDLMDSDRLRNLLRDGPVSIEPVGPARFTGPVQLRSGRTADDTSLEQLLRGRLQALRDLDDFVVGRDYEVAATLALLGDGESAVDAVLRAHARGEALLLALEYDRALTMVREDPRVGRVVDELYAQARAQRVLYERLRGLPLTAETASDVLRQCVG